ncbi:hypothetical protein SAMN02746041_01223 [Desulfacinum hydrothermale DSM 13146]|uniref:Calcineurin-like phosphoesterase domain-containing protein n=1 Tax=Desulfacinum hydrothermale DSM 13146 TaxID=1121390 RepID=A0A1W1XCR8_9BACT|nr:CDP-archaeol synthase [Desulfacinum hydrothermale]SMC21604.1 hypothetical protein SAMN02746041_01223 [Desulfacinum hydrothermale DSM 13146]
MWIPLKCLVLLWLINLVPPLLSHFFSDQWPRPVDGGRVFRDGRPLLGPNKTRRGVAGALVAGTGVSVLLGWPWFLGLSAAALSMIGDMASSFLKRRLNLPSGSNVPVLDQVFEGLLPMAVLSPHTGLGAGRTFLTLTFFVVGAYVGSHFLKQVLLQKPFDDYPRRIRPRVRLRELASCQIRSNPWPQLFHFEDVLMYRLVMNTVFRGLGIYEAGKANAVNVTKRHLTLELEDLPVAFDGYSLLFMSDLHLDGLDGLVERLVAMVREEEVDLCLLGGDYRMENFGPADEALRRLALLLNAVRARDGILAVLGNHDCPEMATALAETPVRFLINESAAVRREEETIWIAGVDDPHYFRCDDLDAAWSRIPAGAFVILLAHSPEIAEEAARRGARLYLCGHTHAGQIQVPFVGPVFTHSRSPRALCQGMWRRGSMTGYTSSGAGVSGSPVRFRTTGEVVILTLKRARKTAPDRLHKSLSGP